jgi:YegS/Rv2252/BmrU family lipid kinase
MAEAKTFLVVNPMSANGRTGKQFPEIAAAVRSKAGEFDHAFTTRIGDGETLAREALKKGYTRVVAVGGDGTANEVVNGFFEGGKPVRPDAVFALIPRGTGGDLRKTFGWTNKVDEAASRLNVAKNGAVDVGRITFMGHDGRERERYFINVASFGVSGVVVDEVNHTSKALGGAISFQLASLKALLKYSDKPIRLSVDDGAAEELKVTCVAVGNGGYFGGGMWVCPKAKPDDGLFDVTVWSGFGLLDFATKKSQIYSGAHVNFPGTRTLRAKKVRAESDHVVLIDVDGEQPGRLPVTIEILPSAIQVCL